MQRHHRMPVWLALVAVGWGAFVAVGVGGGMNVLYVEFSTAFVYYPKLMEFVQHPDINRVRDGSVLRELLDVKQMLATGLALDAGAFEELAKGAGIAVLYLLCRRWIDGVVSGIVLGACVGLGFNLVESVSFMSLGAAEFQYWARQSVALMGAHVAFTAMIGASFGIARQLADPRRRRTVIGLGFLIAIAAHFMNDAAMAYLSNLPASDHITSPGTDLSDDPAQGGHVALVGSSPGLGEAEPDPLPGVAHGTALLDVARVREHRDVLTQSGLADAEQGEQGAELDLTHGIQRRADPQSHRSVDNLVEPVDGRLGGPVGAGRWAHRRAARALRASAVPANRPNTSTAPAIGAHHTDRAANMAAICTRLAGP
jgi:RsiW-degrading membrane proteinase PrsW (M82 family)